MALGIEINKLLAEFIENGKKNGTVRQDIIPMLSVYVMWSSITSLISPLQTKGKYIKKQFSISENEFLEYGFKQIINSVLTVHIQKFFWNGNMSNLFLQHCRNEKNCCQIQKDSSLNS